MNPRYWELNGGRPTVDGMLAKMVEREDAITGTALARLQDPEFARLVINLKAVSQMARRYLSEIAEERGELALKLTAAELVTYPSQLDPHVSDFGKVAGEFLAERARSFQSESAVTGEGRPVKPHRSGGARVPDEHPRPSFADVDPHVAHYGDLYHEANLGTPSAGGFVPISEYETPIKSGEVGQVTLRAARPTNSDSQPMLAKVETVAGHAMPSADAAHQSSAPSSERLATDPFFRPFDCNFDGKWAVCDKRRCNDDQICHRRTSGTAPAAPVTAELLAVRLEQIASGALPFDEYAKGRLKEAASSLRSAIGTTATGPTVEVNHDLDTIYVMLRQHTDEDVAKCVQRTVATCSDYGHDGKLLGVEIFDVLP